MEDEYAMMKTPGAISTPEDLRKLKDQAVKAAAKGKWKAALECYLDLERGEPGEGMWPQKAGEIFRRLGSKPEAIGAYSRAAGKFSRGGFLLKAIASCMLILDLEPGHEETQKLLASHHAARGFTTGLRRAVQPAPPAATPIGRILLGKVAATARPWEDAAPGDEDSGVFEIIIEDDVASGPAVPPVTDTALAVLPRTPLFSALAEPDLRRLIEHVRLQSLANGEYLFRQGDPGDALFVVVSGELAVEVTAPGGGTVEVSRMGEGVFFGEIALIAEQPRSASVRADTATDVLVVHRDDLAPLVADAPEMLQVLLRFVRARLLNSLVETSPFFAALNTRERVWLATHFRFLAVDKGAVLVTEGQRPPGLFIALAGNLSVSAGGCGAGLLLPGELFGEGHESQSRVSVSAESRSFVFELPRDDLVELLHTHGRLLESITALGAGRDERLGLKAG